MSKIGKINISIPDKVKVVLNGNLLSIEGPLGKKSLNLDKRQSIYDKAAEGVKSIESENYKQLNELILSSWEDKKLVSPLILNDDVLKIEKKLQNKKEVVSYKLCGAGGGGYMFVVSKKSQPLNVGFGFEVNIDNRGIRLWKLCI